MGLIEGIAVYAVAGLAVWYWGRGTFWSETLQPDDLGEASEGKSGGDEDESAGE